MNKDITLAEIMNKIGSIKTPYNNISIPNCDSIAREILSKMDKDYLVPELRKEIKTYTIQEIVEYDEDDNIVDANTVIINGNIEYHLTTKHQLNQVLDYLRPTTYTVLDPEEGILRSINVPEDFIQYILHNDVRIKMHKNIPNNNIFISEELVEDEVYNLKGISHKYIALYNKMYQTDYLK